MLRSAARLLRNLELSRLLRNPKVLGLAVLLLALVAVALFVPLPTIDRMREWSDSLGPAFPVAFFVVHAIVTVAPVPRTVFTLAAGLLFGPVVGISLAAGATTVSAAIALVLVRALGRDVVAGYLTHPAVQRIDDRLARRGWLAVGSLRLIAPVPFSITNYCAALSSIRFLPYILATIVGIVPGTVGVVVLGDAIGGDTSPALLALSGACLLLGMVGLVVDARLGVPAEPDLTLEEARAAAGLETGSATIKP
ncbi:TVP38/TMEM64 family protein [Rhodococcus gannanensis]|uniref:TVP38/TMEM64 family membrane protein n=1 Tax=Rhodococcus gannanensis TaxID=1960308 RepID=A0ABW4P5N5_9NOCA